MGADSQLEEEAAARLGRWREAVLRAQQRRQRAPALSEGGGARGDNGTASSALPPACPSNVPSTDPYWSQMDSYAISKSGSWVVYNECRYSNGCRRPFSNLERVESLRRLLKVTQGFLIEKGVQFILYGGTAIGAFRCRDVLPWEFDSDVLVQRDELVGLLDLLKWAPNGTGWNYHPRTRSIDMAALGFPGFQLMEKFPGCLPLAIVDQSTGFFTDLFPMEQSGDAMLSPWWSGKTSCDVARLFPPCKAKACFSMSAANTLPPALAKIHDNFFPVAHNLEAWLKEQYGPSVGVPDVATSGSASDKVALRFGSRLGRRSQG